MAISTDVSTFTELYAAHLQANEGSQLYNGQSVQQSSNFIDYTSSPSFSQGNGRGSRQSRFYSQDRHRDNYKTNNNKLTGLPQRHG